MFKRIAVLGMALFAWCAQSAIAAPVVTLTGPVANSKYLPPAALTVTAEASDSDTGIARVEFYANGLLIGTDTSTPYVIDWTDVPAGSYNLTAKAVSNQNLSKISAAVKVIVNTAPVISLTSPTPDSSMAGLADIVIAADVSDADNNLAKVTFHNGWNIIGTVTEAPYTMTWNDVPPGTYTISARATDSLNEMVMTGSAKVTVVNPLSVSLASPAPNAKFLPTDTIDLTADVNTSNGNSSISQVAFYHGTTLIGTAASAPYTYHWTPAQAGSYAITAKVTDNQGLVKTSAPVKITVNTPPVISLTSPTPDSSMAGPADIVIAADVSDADNNLAKVTFHNGWNIIGTVTEAPYTMTWNDVPPGTYTISARATDSLNEMVMTGSAKVTVTVNANTAPTVSLTAPESDQPFTAPAAIVLQAEASDTDGSIAKVDFYQGNTLIGSVSNAPYSYLWSEVAAGDYSITAKATDNGGSVTTSSPISITVTANQAPTVGLSSPADHASFTAPATITLTADATDSDGSISQVAFYHGDVLIGSTTSAPYTLSWQDVAAGSYAVTAVVTDNLGSSATSAPISVTVAASDATAHIYYIHADHLNTPRLMTDSSNTTVWEWDNSDPYGNNSPVADSGLEFNLRFPGQYFDKETNLHYNYYRDYDPATGRYVQSDPVGLFGGLNTYAYVSGSPISYVDPLGLQAIPVPAIPAPAPGGATMPGGKSGGYDPQTDTYIPPSVPPSTNPLSILCQVAPLACAAAVMASEANGEKPPRGLPPTGIKPPIPDADQCTVGPASRPSEAGRGGQSTYDPRGGEWRWYPGDRWHNPHWDYNPHSSPSSPWENIPHGDLPPVKPVPDPR